MIEGLSYGGNSLAYPKRHACAISRRAIHLKNGKTMWVSTSDALEMVGLGVARIEVVDGGYIYHES